MAYSQKFATIAACSEQKGEIKDFLKVIGFIIDFEEKIMVRSVLKQLTAQTRLLVTDNRLIYGRSVFGRFHKRRRMVKLTSSNLCRVKVCWNIKPTKNSSILVETIFGH